MPSPSALFASILFGIIGLAAFMYGKNSMSWKPMVIGVALMVFPYFIAQTWVLYTVGCGLCGALVLFRD